MPVKHQVSITYRTNNGSVSVPAVEVSGDAELVYDDTIPAGTTNKQIVLALDVSEVKGFVMACPAISATKTIVIKTNSTSSPANTLTLTSAVPGVVYYTGQTGANPLTTDVTSLYVTSTDTVDRRLQIYVCADITP